MARPAADSFFQATSRTRVPEDALTDAFAHLLKCDADFRVEIAPRLGVPRHLMKSSPEIVTQRRTPSGLRRVDLEARFAGAPGHVLWVEVKDQSPEGHDQLWDYKQEMVRWWPEHHSLVVLAPAGHPILESPLAEPLSWLSVAKACERVAVQRGGSHWRKLARNGGVTTLRDFLDFLNARGVAMDTQPITLVDALAVPRVERLLDFGGAVDQVLDAAMLVMDHFAEIPDNAWPTRRQGLSVWHGRTLRRKEGDRLSIITLGGYRAVSFVPSDEWDREDDPRYEAAFAAGVWFDKPTQAVLDALADRAWQQTLPVDVFVTTRDKQAGVRMIQYLVELVAAATTLTEQGEALGRWADAAILTVEELLPTAVAGT